VVERNDDFLDYQSLVFQAEGEAQAQSANDDAEEEAGARIKCERTF
jgi:hypothetical protein